MSKKIQAQVVLAGRTNVGKSSLFNRMASSVESITLDQPGVTRDLLHDVVAWNSTTFQLSDSGGITAQEPKDPMDKKVREKALKAIEQAAVVILVCDAQVGVINEDIELMRLFHRHNKNVVLAVNKVDTQNLQDMLYGFESLGVPAIFYVSALHGRNIGDMLDYVTDQIKAQGLHLGEQEESDFRVVLLGKPNVGKSSLLNMLTNQDRSIVSEIEGTTREPIREQIHFYQQPIELIDTAGVRRKRSVEDTLETMMVKTSLEAVRKAHIVLLLMSADEPYLSAQVLKLASYVFEQGAALILLLNKSDLLDESKERMFKESMAEYKFFTDKLEYLIISCKDGKNVGKILPLVQKVWEANSTKIPQEILTQTILNALMRRPLYKNQQQVRCFGARQAGYAPMRIELNVENILLWEPSHLSYLENVLRKEYNLKSVPVLFTLKQKQKQEKA